MTDKIAEEKAKETPEEIKKRMEANNVLLARRGAMFFTLQRFHKKALAGNLKDTNDDDKIKMLLTDINDFARGNNRLPPHDMAKVALEWESVIRSKADYDPATETYRNPDGVLAFVEDKGIDAKKGIRTLVIDGDDLPEINEKFDFGEHLEVTAYDDDARSVLASHVFQGTLDDQKRARDAEKNGTIAPERIAPSLSDLGIMASISDHFKGAASLPRILRTADGKERIIPAFIDSSHDAEYLTAPDEPGKSPHDHRSAATRLLDEQNPSEEAIKKKLEEWSTLPKLPEKPVSMAKPAEDIMFADGGHMPQHGLAMDARGKLPAFKSPTLRA